MEQFLKYLVDPKTGEDLVKEGDFLVSKSNKYPIVRGIPRFAGYENDQGYTKNFGYQWNKWSQIQFDSKNTTNKMAGYTKMMWEKITGIKHDLNNQVVVDFGCGPGRFIETIRNKKALAIGLDMSSAVEAAGEIFSTDPDVLICQADILESPIRPQSVDGVFSIGVLHHTTNPKKGFSEMVKSLKPDGWISVAVYGTGGYYDNFIVNIYRKIFKTLWPVFGHYPPLIYTYIVVYTTWILMSIPILRTLVRPLLSYIPSIYIKKSLAWSILDTFDSITPSNQSGHTPYEVFHWFKHEHLREIEPGDWGGGTFHAKK